MLAVTITTALNVELLLSARWSSKSSKDHRSKETFAGSSKELPIEPSHPDTEQMRDQESQRLLANIQTLLVLQPLRGDPHQAIFAVFTD